MVILACMCVRVREIENKVRKENLSRTEEPAKAGYCARDRRALQQLALNVHVKRSHLT